LSETDRDLIKLLVGLRDAFANAADAINAYLESKAPLEVKLEKYERLFPEGLRERLRIAEEGGLIAIRPLGFLGPELFGKVLAIVKGQGGSYISDEKGGRFVIPKRT
jgi:hypothetical protein